MGTHHMGLRMTLAAGSDLRKEDMEAWAKNSTMVNVAPQLATAHSGSPQADPPRTLKLQNLGSPWLQPGSIEDTEQTKAPRPAPQRRQRRCRLPEVQKSIDSIRQPRWIFEHDAAHQSLVVGPCGLAGSPLEAAGADTARKRPIPIGVGRDTAETYPSPAGQSHPSGWPSTGAVEESPCLGCGGIWSYGDAKGLGSRQRRVGGVPRSKSQRRRSGLARPSQRKHVALPVVSCRCPATMRHSRAQNWWRPGCRCHSCYFPAQAMGRRSSKVVGPRDPPGPFYEALGVVDALIKRVKEGSDHSLRRSRICGSLSILAAHAMIR